MRFKKSLILLSAFLIAIFLYKESLSYYFFQDDFFEINISQANNINQYFSFFKFRDDIIAYRPISLQNYFFISQSLFGLNPVGFRTVTMVLFLLSGLLVYKIVTKVFKSSETGLFSSFLWLTSSIHFMSITWIAASYNIIGTFFWLLTSVIFLKFLENKKFILYPLSIILFLLTIGSYEFSVTWPAVWGFYFFFILKKSIFKSLRIFSPFIAISIVYLILRSLLIKIPQIPEYQIALNIESAKSFFWYFLWTFNIPEELKKQVVSNLVGFNFIFLAEFWKITAVFFTAFLWIITLSVVIPIVRSKKTIDMKLVWFALIFFSLAISPVLIIPNHTFSMYLTLASIGLYTLMAYLLSQLKNNLVTILVFTIWITTSFIAVSFYNVNSWMIEAQKVSRLSLYEIQDRFPSLPTSSIVLYYLPYPWQWQAMSYQEGIKTIYNDQTLGIYYNEESLRRDFREGQIKGPVYIYDQ